MMTSDSQAPSTEGDGKPFMPPRPFVPGRGVTRQLSHGDTSGISRPFRIGAAEREPSVIVHAVAEIEEAPSEVVNETATLVDRDEASHGAEAIDVGAAMAEPVAGWQEGTGESEAVDAGAASEEPLPGWQEDAPETTFTPLVSWDPLADVVWRADSEGPEVDSGSEAVANPATVEDVPDAEWAAPPAGFSPADHPNPEGVQFAERLARIAEAIRAGEAEALLGENSQDPLTALVVGFYLGTVRRGKE